MSPSNPSGILDRVESAARPSQLTVNWEEKTLPGEAWVPVAIAYATCAEVSRVTQRSSPNGAPSAVERKPTPARTRHHP